MEEEEAAEAPATAIATLKAAIMNAIEKGINYMYDDDTPQLDLLVVSFSLAVGELHFASRPAPAHLRTCTDLT
jgi:hypothetical protein